MFIFKNGCTFELNGVEITVPANFGIDGYAAESEEDWLIFLPLDKSYSVDYQMWYDGIGTKESLFKKHYDMGHRIRVDTIEKFEHNGLAGHHLTYIDTNSEYYEARFLIEESDDGNTELNFCICTRNHDIERIKASHEFKQIFQGIRKI